MHSLKELNSLWSAGSVYLFYYFAGLPAKSSQYRNDEGKCFAVYLIANPAGIHGPIPLPILPGRP
jgi:hypothetical protein